MTQSLQDALLTLVSRAQFRKPKKDPQVPGPEFLTESDTRGVSTPSARVRPPTPGLASEPGGPRGRPYGQGQELFNPANGLLGAPIGPGTGTIGPVVGGGVAGGSLGDPQGLQGPGGPGGGFGGPQGPQGPQSLNGPGGSDLADGGEGPDSDGELIQRLLRSMLSLDSGARASMASILTSAAGISTEQALDFSPRSGRGGPDNLVASSLSMSPSGGLIFPQPGG